MEFFQTKKKQKNKEGRTGQRTEQGEKKSSYIANPNQPTKLVVGNAEKDHPDSLSLAGDGFDTVIKAKAALDAVPACTNNVSCADILAIATRDVVNLAGGIFWQVELGRLDGLVSTASSVNGKLPQPTDNVSQLKSLFASHGLTQIDMVALSGAHTVEFFWQ
ncbi:hypothetical protein Cgig2_033230 [Carnegiea gigantea]|uniref:peroxidase n=1 Tax=Carnegiea gigantea TaxID=171969 RepID=A0A9Q1K1M1_9CARY|nr:hypothetical protein Cgig2_033230 [Carnegiea gigantea]